MNNHFVYPFNFAPISEKPPRGYDSDNTKSPIGEIRKFQSLDSYKGHSGRIEFSLMNVSPFFVPDSEHTTYYKVSSKNGDSDKEKNEHPVKDFFNIDSRLAIPGTSIKGMLRNIVEAVSNSSFGIFSVKDDVYRFRKADNISRADKDLFNRKWGRLCKDDNGYYVEPFATAKIWREAFDNALGLKDDKSRAKKYEEFRRNQTTVSAELWQLHTGAPLVRSFSGAGLPYFEHFSKKMSNVKKGKLIKRSGFKSEVIIDSKQRWKGPMMKDITKEKIPHHGIQDMSFRVVPKIPHVNTKLKKTFKEDRVCMLSGNGINWQAIERNVNIILWPHKGWDEMDSSQRKRVHYIKALYRKGKPIRVDDAAFDFFKKANCDNEDYRKPKPGDIVCFLSRNNMVVEMGPVGMYKSPELSNPGELAGKTPWALPPEKNTNLCPASRLFGWSPEEKKKGKKKETSPVAGRVRVGTAWSDSRLNETVLLPLKILGSPKPKYYPFYLKPEDKNKNMGEEAGYYSMDSGGWWHNAGLLRGRKFYVHHPTAISNDKEKACDYVKIKPEMINKDLAQKPPHEIKEKDLRTNQNLTAAVLPPGKVFKGYIEFDSLSNYELGLLLWSISLSDSPLNENEKLAHKLGMGRPLGMGSIKIKIEKIIKTNPVGGWRTADESNIEVIDHAAAENLVKTFKSWMITGDEEIIDESAVSAFDSEEFYKELCNIHHLNLAGKSPVQYYPPGKKAYEGFSYFMEQRNQRPHNRGKEETLLPPSEIRGGKRQGG